MSVQPQMSAVWRYFVKHPRGQFAICEMCGVEVSQHGASTTTSLWKHLKTKHAFEYNILQNEKRELENQALNSNVVNCDIQATEEMDIKPPTPDNDANSCDPTEMNPGVSEKELFVEYNEERKEKLHRVFSFFDSHLDLLFSQSSRAMNMCPDSRTVSWTQFSKFCCEEGLIPRLWNENQLKRFFLARKKNYVLGRLRLRQRGMSIPLAEWEKTFLGSLGLKVARDPKKPAERLYTGSGLPPFLNGRLKEESQPAARSTSYHNRDDQIPATSLMPGSVTPQPTQQAPQSTSFIRLKDALQPDARVIDYLNKLKAIKLARELNVVPPDFITAGIEFQKKI